MIYIPALIIFLSILIFAAISVLITAYVGYRKTFFHIPAERNPYSGLDSEADVPYRDLRKRFTDMILEEEYEDIYTKAEDGTPLHARLYLRNPDAPFVIQCHGYKSMPHRDLPGMGLVCLKSGYNIIMIDHRAHGKSGANTITFGVKESSDCLRWAEFLIKRYGSGIKILLQGISMGAATVILASSREDLPKCVVGVMADCPYSSGSEIIKKVMKDCNLPAKLLYPAVWLGALIFGGFNISAAEVKAAASESKVPILLVHGEADSFVPCYMSEEIAKSSPLVEFHSFANAEHAFCFLEDEGRYVALALEFMEKRAPIAKKSEGYESEYISAS